MGEEFEQKPRTVSFPLLVIWTSVKSDQNVLASGLNLPFLQFAISLGRTGRLRGKSLLVIKPMTIVDFVYSNKCGMLDCLSYMAKSFGAASYKSRIWHQSRAHQSANSPKWIQQDQRQKVWYELGWRCIAQDKECRASMSSGLVSRWIRADWGIGKVDVRIYTWLRSFKIGKVCFGGVWNDENHEIPEAPAGDRQQESRSRRNATHVKQDPPMYSRVFFWENIAFEVSC